MSPEHVLCIQVSQLSPWMAEQFVFTACLHNTARIFNPWARVIFYIAGDNNIIKSRRLTVCRGLGLQVQAWENLGFELIKCTCVVSLCGFCPYPVSVV